VGQRRRLVRIGGVFRRVVCSGERCRGRGSGDAAGTLLERVLQRRCQGRCIQRAPRQVVPGAEAQCAHRGGFVAALGAHDDDRRLGPCAQRWHRREGGVELAPAGHFGHVHAAQDQVELLRRQPVLPRFQRCRVERHRRRLRIEDFQVQAQPGAELRLVLDDEDPRRRVHCPIIPLSIPSCSSSSATVAALTP
jgi:hypothetical protein